MRTVCCCFLVSYLLLSVLQILRCRFSRLQNDSLLGKSASVRACLIIYGNSHCDSDLVAEGFFKGYLRYKIIFCNKVALDV